MATEKKAAEQPADNIAKLQAPEGATSITIDDKEYAVDPKTETISLPSHLVGEALSHGYTKVKK